MIDPEKRKAIFRLHQEGMSIREISRRLKASRNTVRAIIEQSGNMPAAPRADRIKIDPELVSRLYAECDGWIQRIHEKLSAEQGIVVGYSTLTRMVRELELNNSLQRRCARVADEPGAEMQQDTSVYTIALADRKTRLIASLLYFRYSKLRYLKFFRSFNRFQMQCFFHEALSHWGFTAGVCIIDNTNLARLRGTGKNAVIHPEMEEFSRRYGFRYQCHELNHSNRKAGNERSFYTVETNFFPGRTFVSLQDLNHQALQWATVTMANRPVSKTRMIPARAFEFEQGYLRSIPPAIEPPYSVHHRGTDQYGYAAFDGNYYWVPGSKRSDVLILQYSDRIKIYCKRELLAQYMLPADGVKNQLISPEGLVPPVCKPKSRSRPTEEEEKKLRSLAPEVNAYLDFALAPKGITRHRLIRQLFSLSGKIAPAMFTAAVTRALKYRITDIDTIERICLLYLRAGNQQIPSMDQIINEDIESREAYREGCSSAEVDLSVYEEMYGDDDHNG
jgi:transposase